MWKQLKEKNLSWAAHRSYPARHQWMSRSDRWDSTRHLGAPPFHNWSAHCTGFHHRGPAHCHKRRSGMALVSRCPCLCTPGRQPRSSGHLLMGRKEIFFKYKNEKLENDIFESLHVCYRAQGYCNKQHTLWDRAGLENMNCCCLEFSSS